MHIITVNELLHTLFPFIKAKDIMVYYYFVIDDLLQIKVSDRNSVRGV